jgi:hypothetical protein
MVLADVPDPSPKKCFYDLLAAGWASGREEAVGPMETVGLGFLWRSRRTERAAARPPRPWSLIRSGLEERGMLSPRANVYMIRSEVVRIGSGEQPRLVVSLERN